MAAGIIAAMCIMAAMCIGTAYGAVEATYIESGGTVAYTPTDGDVSAGTVVVQNDLVGVANGAITSNTVGSLEVGGVYDVQKAAGSITAGAPVYWDADGTNLTITTGVACTTVAGNTFMGFALKAAASTSQTVRVVLRSYDSSDAGYIVATNTLAALLVETNRAFVAEAAATRTATNSAIQYFLTPGAMVTQAVTGVDSPFTNVFSAKGVLLSHTP
jgi:predicted RecA/RadA family phage recombinase